MTIDLKDIFIKVMRQSSLDANKSSDLVVEQGDVDLFGDYANLVVMDIVPKLAGYLEEDIEVTDDEIIINVEGFYREGERMFEEAVSQALISGVLYYFQRGAPGFEHVELNNKLSYDKAIKMLSNAIDHRRQTKMTVIKRTL